MDMILAAAAEEAEVAEVEAAVGITHAAGWDTFSAAVEAAVAEATVETVGGKSELDACMDPLRVGSLWLGPWPLSWRADGGGAGTRQRSRKSTTGIRRCSVCDKSGVGCEGRGRSV
jgi:hypothetical protein